MVERPSQDLDVNARAAPLASQYRSWLRQRLEDEAAAPLVPVSALEAALARRGLTVADLPHPLATPESLLAQSRLRLFPAQRLRALERFFLRSRENLSEAGAETEAGIAARLAQAMRTNAFPVLAEVLAVSLERTRGLPRLERVLKRIRTTGWPARAQSDVEGYLPVVRKLPVRVAPVDIISALREVSGLPKAARSRTREQWQLPLLGPNTRPLVEQAHRLSNAGRQALGAALDDFVAHHSADDEVRRYARAVSAFLEGAPIPPAALDALVRESALELLATRSAAELFRIEATLQRGAPAATALVSYGDYLARALRSEEAIRAYQAARHLAEPEDRLKIDERIVARRDRIAEGTRGRTGPRSDPRQLTLLFDNNARESDG